MKIAQFIAHVLRLFWSYREIRIVIVGGFSLFLLLALCSYSSADATFFSYSTNHEPLHNWCGFLGAHIAAFLFFCWGMAAFLLLAVPAFYLYLLIKKLRWKQEWERFISYMTLPWIFSCLFSLYHFDLWQPQVPGGFIGHHLIKVVRSWADMIGAMIVMHMLLCICLMIIFRESFFHVFIWLFKRVQKLRPQRFFLKAAYAKNRASQATGALLHKMHDAWFATDQKQSLYDQYGYDIDSLDHLIETNDPQSLENFFKQQNTQENQTSPIADNAIPATKLQEDTFDDMVADQDSKTFEQKKYALPNLSIFVADPREQQDIALAQELEKKARVLQEKLERFGVMGKITAIKKGPVVTLYEYQPDIDTKISKIITLEDDLALALQALSIRIIAPIPGKSLVGFEVANKQRKSVSLASIIHCDVFTKTNAQLPIIVGEDTTGNAMVLDLARMPHLLMAGSTGSGKSVALNAMLISLLCKRSPHDMRLILVDPKRLEFAAYADIAHLLFPIVTDPRQSVPILRWVVEQMEQRYELMAQAGARNIADYQLLYEKKSNQLELIHLPYIVVIIDELADLMMTVGREIEDMIIRITQMARAAGIHLIAATQRPSVDVITGLIKVNFPSRISFRVTSKVDSRTILDCAGADKLLGYGDMLFLDGADGQLKRAHGAYVSDAEIAKIVGHIKAEQLPQYLDTKVVFATAADDNDDIDQELFEQILLFLKEVDDISISLLQRRFRIGYNRSARIIDKLESQGLITSAKSGRTRKVIR